MINQDKISSSISNSSKVNIGEIWDTDSFTWATESRTWDDMISIITNNTKISSSMTNQSRP